VAVGTLDLHNLEKQKQDTIHMLGALAPHTYLEAGLFVLLSVCAGLCEEIIFRGYLQSQFRAMGGAPSSESSRQPQSWARSRVSRGRMMM